ncbi:hypothetical protein PsorP6_013000 [Peronosclerospora sorghi]|uniref:Uncharacterized protein n=1 Tax=Peronosclerospora sorghi TaxID=230839 RepID=A0ACC0WJB1_9STRA|nr:hypothetical protein PsorP6_013000 [Peronosclerospora sorghi]
MLGEEERVHADRVPNTLYGTNTDKTYTRANGTTTEDENVREAEDLRVPEIIGSFIEYHANIGCYQCYLFLDCARLKDQSTVVPDHQLAIQVDSTRVEVTYIDEHHPNMEVIWWMQIEQSVDMTKCTIEEKNDHWYVRLPIQSSEKQPLGGFSSFTQVSPIELQSENYAIIHCRKCNARLLGDRKNVEKNIHKVLPLPSANWMDMFDFWGAGVGAFEHIPRENIYAQKHRVLVGESYILLHSSDLIAAATTKDYENDVDGAFEEKHEWIPLICTACCERIGLCNVEQPETIRLHKYLISACPLFQSTLGDHVESIVETDNIFSKYTIDSILSAKLLEKADSDGTFRFDDKYVSTQDQGGANASPTPIHLQLLSWETRIKQQDATTFRRVLKVLYGPVQPTLSKSGPLPAQEVSLPPAACLSIAQRLKTSSTLLPSSLRTFNRLNVGYLFA